MIDISKGRYWDEGIQLIDGCTPCSPGCDHCWSATQAHRFRRGICYDGKVDLSVTNFTDKNGRFDGRITCNPDRLKRFNTRKPKVFAIWNDLFHEDVPGLFINEVYFTIAEIRGQNVYLILTKRPLKMLESTKYIHLLADTNYKNYYDNIWHGLTVCNQQEADEKIPIFLQVPGKKFLSIEPMLGEIELSCQRLSLPEPADEWLDGIDAVLLGGETGSGARPMHPDWVRSVRDQCTAAGVPFFFKQWGEWISGDQTPMEKVKGASMYRVGAYHDWGNGLVALRAGKKESGRHLDGRTHDELPWMKG